LRRILNSRLGGSDDRKSDGSDQRVTLGSGPLLSLTDDPLRIARRFDPAFDAATVELRPSRGNNYLGVTLTVTATSREQLDELYRTLSTHPMVKVVL